MPGGDRTGPMGYGSKTGRGLGYCSGSGSPGYTTGVPAGASRGAGRGAGRGFRCRRNPGSGRGLGFAAPAEFPAYYYPAPAQARAKSDLDSLESRVRSLKHELETLTESLKKLQPGGSAEKE